MSLPPRYRRYVTIIAILLLLLGIKYIARHGDNDIRDEQSIQDLSIDRYTIHADKENRLTAVKDIFFGSKVADAQHRTIYSSRGKATSGAVTKPVITKKIEPVINENVATVPASDGEIERVKLLGIVFHENKKKAFMALDRQRVIAAVGDTVFGRYQLSDIAINSVELVDTKDNLQKTIMVSGK